MNPIGDEMRMPDGTPLPFSAGIESNGLVFLSGQLALRGGALPPGGIGEQTHAVFDNIEHLLGLAGLDLGAVVKVTAWLENKADFAGFNAVYASRFSAPYPARSTVVSSLLLPGALVEIEVVARRGK